MSEGSSIVVVSNHDGKKYKMVMRGDMGGVTVGKIKRYLTSASGIQPEQQQLRFNTQILHDAATGRDVGLFDGAVLFLDVLSPASQPPPIPYPGTQQLATPSYQIPSPQPSRISPPRNRSSPPSDGFYSSGAESIGARTAQLRQAEDEFRRLAEEAQKQREKAIEEHELARVRERERQAAFPPPPPPPPPVQGPITSPFVSATPIPPPPHQPVSPHLNTLVQVQQQQIDDLRRQMQDLQHSQMYRPSPQRQVATAHVGQTPAAPKESPVPAFERLRRNLRRFGYEYQLGDNLELDSNHTCVVNVPAAGASGESVSLLLTYDPVTERLYVYTTILNELPHETSARLRLYEALLEGALLGRDMAGGGVGVSCKSNLILQSVSLDMRHCDDDALRAIVPMFLQSVSRWTRIVKELCGTPVSHGPPVYNAQTPQQESYALRHSRGGYSASRY